MILETRIHLGYSCSRQTILTIGDEEVYAVNHAFHRWQLLYNNNKNNNIFNCKWAVAGGSGYNART